VSSSLLNDLARGRETIRYRIESLIGIRHNASLTGMYKTGKTGLSCDLATALADGRPFLGSLAVVMPQGRIGFWNGEMDRHDFLDYTRPIGIQNPSKIETLHLRGYRVPLLTDAGAAWTVWWLRYNGIEIWINDSWARLCAWSGIDENDNSAVARLAGTIDEIKSQAGVAQFITTAHTGRAKHDEGTEHARGATALDDWVDVRMVMTRQGNDRFLFAEGRQVGLDEIQLIFDPVTRRSYIGTGDRSAVRAQTGVEIATQEVANTPGINKTDLLDAVRACIPGHNQDHAATAIKEAAREGKITIVDGPRNSKLHYPVPSPHQQAARDLHNSWTGY
jgi:hypothetical protein